MRPDRLWTVTDGSSEQMPAGHRRSVATAQSVLFVPGSRPERFEKALDSGADLVVIDLEDAVPADAKPDARRATRSFLDGGAPVAVRINALGTPWIAADVKEVATRAAAVMLPKAEAGRDLAQLASRLGGEGVALVALVETAAGVLDASTTATTPGVERLAFGSLDLAAELNVDPRNRDALAMARASLVFASAAAGLGGPVDGVCTDVDDEDGLRDEAAYACGIGFDGKLCIHPRQVTPIHEAFGPSADDVVWAAKVVDAARDGEGVVVVDGAMVDRPVVQRARRILARSTARQEVRRR